MPYLGNVPSSFNVGTNNIDSGAVTTEKIADGAVVNTDVNASAAIAGTKISPDFGSQNLLTTGTATAASLIPTSSTAPTNGLFLPAANTVGISTGGSQRATIDSSGRLLVGTSSVSHNSRAVIAGRQDGNAGGTLVLESTSSSPANGDTLGNLRYGTSGNTASLAAAAIGAERDGGTWTNNSSMPARLTFSTTADGASSPTERLRITSAGLVGVGTSSPSTLIHGAVSSGSAILRLENTANSGESALQLFGKNSGGTVRTATIKYDNADYFRINTTAAVAIAFETSDTERLRITGAGLVGIGTSSPQNLLHLRSDANSAVTHLYLMNKTSGANVESRIAFTTAVNDLSDDRHAYIGAVTTGAGQNGNNFVIATNPNGASAQTRLFVSSTGNVGIGTTSPGQPLTVNSTSTSSIANFTTNQTATNIFISDTNTSANLSIGSAGNNLTLQTNGSERARIDGSGRLLVGTSSTATTCRSVIQGHSGGSGGTALLYLAIDSNSPSNGTRLGSLRFSDNRHSSVDIDASFAAEITAVRDGGTWTSGTSQPTRLMFLTTADGAASPTERMRITNNGFLKISNDNSYTGIDTNAHGVRQGTGNNWTWMTVNDTVNPFGINISFPGAAPNNTTNIFLRCQDSGTLRLDVRSNGGIANFSANNANLSDRNAKKDISPAAGTWDCIKEWEIVNYRYKEQPDDACLNLGVIAQQVAESCPEVITVFSEATEDQPEKLGVKEQQMYWMAIKALQEAQVRIEQLEAKVAALESA